MAKVLLPPSACSPFTPKSLSVPLQITSVLTQACYVVTGCYSNDPVSDSFPATSSLQQVARQHSRLAEHVASSPREAFPLLLSALSLVSHIHRVLNSSAS